MRSKLKLTYSIFLLLLPLISYTQVTTSDGFIIANNYDTISGKLEYAYTGFSQKCVFIKENSLKIDFLSPDQIKQFFISPNINFKAKRFNKEQLFFQVLSEGKINLDYDGNDLFISNASDSLIRLKGGTESYRLVDGKSYVKETTIYKTQLKRCVGDTNFYKKIDNLNFDRKLIFELIEDINNKKPSAFVRLKFPKHNVNHYGIEIGFSINSFYLNNTNYINDSLEVEYKSRKSNVFTTWASVNSWIIGINGRRKIGKTNFYLSIGANYEKLLNTRIETSALLHQFMSWENGSIHNADTIGKVTDIYAFKLSSFSFPISFNEELSYNKFRPFYNIGITNKIYLNKNISLNRKVNRYGKFNEEKNLKVQVPPFFLGVKLGLGCRYLVNKNCSISGGFNFEYFQTTKSNNNVESIFSKNFFISYTFL
jgi:hypothetical protein